MLLQLLTHVGHGGVADLHRVPVDHLSQLVPNWEAGVEEIQELLADVAEETLDPYDPPGQPDPPEYPKIS